jgi:hypothetical protein
LPAAAPLTELIAASFGWEGAPSLIAERESGDALVDENLDG